MKAIDQSVEARNLAKQKEYLQSLKLLWSEDDMNLFMEEVTEMLEEEFDASTPSVNRKFIRKSQEAIRGMQKNHNLMRSMLSIETQQLSEIDNLDADCVVSEGKVKVCKEKRKELEKIIDGLTIELAEAQLVNTDKKKALENRDNQMEQAKSVSVEMKAVFQEKMNEALKEKERAMNEVKGSIADVQMDNKSKLTAIDTANKGANALKGALNMCSDGLKDSGVVGE